MNLNGHSAPAADAAQGSEFRLRAVRTTPRIPSRKRGTPSCAFRRPCRAFSLLELLIVMVLIIVMFTLYFGGGSRSFQSRQIAACAKNLDTMFLALKTFASDNNGQFPALAGAKTSEPVLSLLIPRSTTGTACFICPGCKDKPLPEAQPFNTRKISYAYYPGWTAADGADKPLVSDRQVNANPKTAGQPLFSADGKAPGSNHNKFGGNVMFCDGSVRSSGPLAAFDLTNAPGGVLLNPNP